MIGNTFFLIQKKILKTNPTFQFIAAKWLEHNFYLFIVFAFCPKHGLNMFEAISSQSSNLYALVVEIHQKHIHSSLFRDLVSPLWACANNNNMAAPSLEFAGIVLKINVLFLCFGQIKSCSFEVINLLTCKYANCSSDGPIIFIWEDR